MEFIFQRKLKVVIEDVNESKLRGREEHHTIVLSLLFIQFTICKVQGRNRNSNSTKMETINKHHTVIDYHFQTKKKKKN